MDHVDIYFKRFHSLAGASPQVTRMLPNGPDSAPYNANDGYFHDHISVITRNMAW